MTVSRHYTVEGVTTTVTVLGEEPVYVLDVATHYSDKLLFLYVGALPPTITASVQNATSATGLCRCSVYQ